ncbi:uncharacterized protein [Battus philenor]|uniref:uncharacterized protein n=1 Tax=Battus philenor TaxID=42288 RepID=UPI0035CF67AA
MEKLTNGIMINSNVFLSEQNYHTLVSVNYETLKCTVCDALCKTDSYQDHIRSEVHLTNLETHQPIEKYDLCVIRKIHNAYHCGVCNEVIHLDAIDNHIETKSHENKLLFSMNKVSDITHDLNRSKNKTDLDCYHFNSRSIYENDFKDDENSEGFYDMYLPDKRYIDEYENQSTDECLSDEGENINQFSYASIARTPKATPKFLEKKIGGSVFKVNFDSWHMILVLKSNKFYCMACKKDYHISLRSEHCFDDIHLKKLRNCSRVIKYTGYLIRKVDNNLYHCAHCNNLRPISDIEEHIEAKHQIRNKKHPNEVKTPTGNIIEVKTPKENITEVKTPKENIIEVKTPKENIIKDKSDVHKFDEVIETKSSNVINDNCINNKSEIDGEIKELYIFCAKFTISLLSYNMIVHVENEYFCSACDVVLYPADVAKHITYVSHIENLNRRPFIYDLNANLIRSGISNIYLHCSICNVLVENDLINKHIMETAHVDSLNKTKTSRTRSKRKLNRDVNQPSTSNNFEEHDVNTKLRVLNQACDSPSDVKKDAATENIGYVYIDSETSDRDKTKDENQIILESDSDSFDEPMCTEEFVILKRKKIVTKVTFMSYNTLVPVGDGTRCCCMCSVDVTNENLKSHLESRIHKENLTIYKFLEKYEKHFLRQIYFMYHCAQCNVTFTWRDLNVHLSWPLHLNRVYSNTIEKKTVNVNGQKLINVELKKEIIHRDIVEPSPKIGTYIEFTGQTSIEIPGVVQKKKVVICDGEVIEVDYDAWHTLTKSKSAIKCCLCQKYLKSYELTEHINDVNHNNRSRENFLNGCASPLIRQVTPGTCHCMFCNIEFPITDLNDHIKDKKHVINFETTMKDSELPGKNAGCDENAVTLHNVL